MMSLRPRPADTVRGFSDDPAFLHDFALRRTSIHRRHGDPFPLPRLRDELGTSIAATSLRQRADDAFRTLNELAAVPFDQTDRTTSTPLTQVQSWMVEDILRRITQHGPPPEMSGQLLWMRLSPQITCMHRRPITSWSLTSPESRCGSGKPSHH